MDRHIYEVLRLLNNGERVYLSDIEAATGLKKYKINNIVQKINNNSEEFGCVIDVKRGRGYRCMMYDQKQFVKRYKQLLSNLNNYTIEQQIFRHVAYSKDYVMVKDIEESLYLSRAKVKSAIDELNQQLVNYKLELKYTPYKGYWLIGEERYIRKYLIDNLLFLSDSSSLHSNHLSGYQNDYINNVLHVQHERIAFGFMVNSNNFGLKLDTLILKKFDLKLNYPEIELNYLGEVLKLFDLNTDSDMVELLEKLNNACSDKYDGDVKDPFVFVHLQNIINMCKYGHEHQYISLKMGYKLQNEVSNFVANFLKEHYSWNDDSSRIAEYSNLIFPVVEYVVRQVTTRTMSKYFKLAILDNGNVFTMQGVKEQLKAFNPNMSIDIIKMSDIYNIDFTVYDAVFTQHFLKQEQMDAISGTRRINISATGIALELDKLQTYMYTLDYIYFIRKYISLEQLSPIENYHVLETDFDLNLYVTNEISNCFYIDRDHNSIYVAEDLYYSEFKNTAFIYSLYWRWGANKPEWFNKKKISIGDIIADFRY